MKDLAKRINIKDKTLKQMVKKIIIAGILTFAFSNAHAQMDSLKMNFDLRSRGELDNGVKTLIPKGKSAETTIYSRARLGVDYYYKNLEIYFSAQDVRTWGETASTTGKNQNFILNEAWAKYQISSKVGVKLGRQILSYDDQRLIGPLDWSMQGRSFDAVKGIFNLNKNSKLEAVVTYNNDDNDANDSKEREIYGIAESEEITKSLQVLHYQYSNSNQFQFSTIVMNNVLQNLSGAHYDMLTVGVNFKKYFENIGIFGSTYYQTGKNTQAQSKSAYQFSLNADFIISSKFHGIIGTEWLSGKNYDTSSGKNKSFSPLYGTNHIFNGYMDYFYVGNYFNSFGLNDYYLKTTTKLSPNSILTANLHAFTSNGKLGKTAKNENISSYLGTEVDFVFQHQFGKIITLHLGHSFMFGSKSMEFIKNNYQPKDLQTWSWIGIKIAPQFKLK